MNRYKKIEFWIATFAAVIALIVLFSSSYNGTPHDFLRVGMKFDDYENFLYPYLLQIIAIYAAFLFVTRITEKIENKNARWGQLFGIYLITIAVIFLTNRFIDAWIFLDVTPRYEAYNQLFFKAFLKTSLFFIGYLAYYFIKQFFHKSLAPSKKSKRAIWLAIKIAGSIITWLLVFAILAENRSYKFFAILWLICIPYFYIIFVINNYLIIPSLKQKKPHNLIYVLIILLTVLFLNFLATALIANIGDYDTQSSFILYTMLLLVVIVFVLPFSWYYYFTKRKSISLSTAIGSSEANLYLLRSQINPHFLFNALNTLYGTALQENANRTGEGIQKLGDMMRFMLHENDKDKILLIRELEYLNNYIELQKLRTAQSPNITIETNIQADVPQQEIAPMLLIPFVENAFKHGISLKDPSFIKISLNTHSGKLFFDVSNSIRPKNNNDPEKTKTGIGLQNVKQRLELLYPQNHELIIRKSLEEYFVHLTLVL